MEILLNPNVAYLFLVSGITLTLLAILTPGTGVLEIGAFFALALAGWAVYTLPINPWALVSLVLSVISFILALRKSGYARYLAFSILTLILGSTFLFREEAIWQPAVHPLLAAVASLLVGGFFWIATSKTLEASAARPAHDLSPLIGARGEARTEIHEEGVAFVAGELWTARSQTPIPAGTPIRVLRREGLILEVEPEADPPTNEPVN